jgi:hypothetical protein
MSRFQRLLDQPMGFIISLPANDLQLAKAAIEEGADAVKFHINVHHRATGNIYLSTSEYKDLFHEVRSSFDGAMGIVLGDKTSAVTKDEVQQCVQLGFDYYSLYVQHVPSFLLQQNEIAKTCALPQDFDLNLLSQIKALGTDAIEVSTVHKDDYGTPFNMEDALYYSYIREQVNLPIIIPSQRRLIPEDVATLKSIGTDAIMLGAMSIGKTEESIRQVVSSFRNEIDRLR